MSTNNNDPEDDMAWDPDWDMDMGDEEEEVDGGNLEDLGLTEVKAIATGLQSIIGDVIETAKGNWDSEKKEFKQQGPKIPKVSILGVQFQWEDSDPSNSGIPLYTIGADWTPEDRSPVAYAIASTAEAVKNGNLKVRARFAWDRGKGRIQVRTRIKAFTWTDILTNEVADQQPGEDVLGTVAPTTVFFNDTQHSIYRGKHSYVPLPIENPQFPQLGVGVYDFNWIWEFRLPDEGNGWQEEWHTIRVVDNSVLLDLDISNQMTRHRAYITLDLPAHPWTTHRIPDISQGLPVALPLWRHGLELACKWARTATTPDEAAKLIADELHHSGRFTYHPNSHYIQVGRKIQREFGGIELQEREETYIAYFQFDKVLERLKGGHGLGPKVNCFDCALTVATLGNMLGCRLQAGKLQNQADIDASDEHHYMDNRFEINPVRAIGQSKEGGAISGVHREGGAFFAYHTVAWSAPHGDFGTEEDFRNPECRIFDASLELLIDGDAYSPSGMKLGNADTPSTYIHFLAADTPDGKPRCKPQPITVVDVQISG